MGVLSARFLRFALLVCTLGGLYFLAVQKHEDRDRMRLSAVELTPTCKAKLDAYGLSAGSTYRSPYLVRVSGMAPVMEGYSEEDVRAIQRGCNIIDDLQGFMAQGGNAERWNAQRFVRGSHTTCTHCHQDAGDKQ
ncbi:MAG: hypothetical protein ING77_14820, partial [Rhodocyclaceae bacterium]|nr:hypothetical protein [Rhodocyclaceae bacterium]